MNKKLIAVNIVQAPNAGTVRFIEQDKDGKQVKGSPIVAVQFGSAAEAGTFTQGNVYEISIKPAK